MLSKYPGNEFVGRSSLDRERKILCRVFTFPAKQQRKMEKKCTEMYKARPHVQTHCTLILVYLRNVNLGTFIRV